MPDISILSDEFMEEIKQMPHRNLALTEDEPAFHNALEVNDSAVKILGDEILRTIAHDLVASVKKNATIVWRVKEGVCSKMKMMVKRILRRYGYTLEKQAAATETILKRAELLADAWAASWGMSLSILLPVLDRAQLGSCALFHAAISAPAINGSRWSAHSCIILWRSGGALYGAQARLLER